MPFIVIEGDLNGDHYGNMIILYSSSPQIPIYFNTDNETFIFVIMYHCKEILQRLVVADVDDDDKLDIIVTYIGFNNIAKSFNDGDGTFSKSTTYTTDCSPDFVAIGNIINDNALYIVVANIL
ncbi:unnamed protein product [Adineta steineri]|uniref:VCBS repeat-containing protein n=1 Tax=Adineta steineri TaxID=433720 RepID=A0A813RCY9_9BILA|nr:unnamed protein product [Adineta steineri]CAF4108951.1 unnamed protein product [Adineta steineri]